MPIAAKYLFFVSMDVEADKLELFHEVYDEEHIPNLLTVPGVNSVTRVEGEDFAVSIGGERKEVAHSGPSYTAIYEIDDPSVLTSEAWTVAVERGRWATEVRPFTFNRRHTLSDDRGNRILRFENGHCTFLKNNACQIHEVKPVQCRTWPFWEELLESEEIYCREVMSFCPGSNQGALVPGHEIARQLQESKDAVLEEE